MVTEEQDFQTGSSSVTFAVQEDRLSFFIEQLFKTEPITANTVGRTHGNTSEANILTRLN